MSNKKQVKEQREYAWNYFQLHASQRMASFNFFVVISALFTAGLAGTFGHDFDHHWLGMVLGLGLMIVSFTFWNLDQRVRFLIKHAETALKDLEKTWLDDPEEGSTSNVALFCLEERRTIEAKAGCDMRPSTWHMSYAQCFAVTYVLFGTIGLVGAIRSIVEVVTT